MSNQLVKRDYSEGYRKVFPKTFIDAIKDRNSGMSLAEILQGFNMYFLSYNGNKALTRCSVPSYLRKEGLWITYVLYDHTVITEWYNSDNIDDEAFGSDDSWRQASNMLVGDISVSADGYWVIEGEKTSTKAQGETGITPLLRFGDNNKLQASYNEGKEWEDISGDITNNLKISKYIGINEALPTSGIAEGTIYMKGPYYDENDTNNNNPIYRMWIYAWKGNTLAWQDNGEFTSIFAGVVQETGNSTTQVMSQDAITRELIEISEELNKNPFEKGNAEHSAVLKGGNNQVLSEGGVALGKDNLVGLKGWYYGAINKVSPKLINVYLTNEQKVPAWNQSYTLNPSDANIVELLGKDTIVSLINDSKYDNIFKIVQGRAGMAQLTTVDGTDIPFDAIKRESDLSPEDYSIYCLDKPEIGSADLGKYSFANGSDNKSINVYTEVSGKGNVAKGKFAKVWGKDNVGGYNTTTLGTNNTNLADNSFVSGTNNINEGNNSVIHGNKNKNYGKRAFVVGNENITNNENEAAFGKYNNSGNDTQFSIGIGTSDTDRKNAFEVKLNGDIHIGGVDGRIQDKLNDNPPILKSTGVGSAIQTKEVETFVDETPNSPTSGQDIPTEASGNYSVVLNGKSNASAKRALAHGNRTIAQGENSHTEGHCTQTVYINEITNGYAAHAEGYATAACGTYSHAEGNRCVSIASNSHTEGYLCSTDLGAESSHAEGYETGTFAPASHTEGNNTKTHKAYSHAEGRQTETFGEASHTEGNETITEGDYAHAEGWMTRAKGAYSHSEGQYTFTYADAAHSEGNNTHAQAPFSHTEGIGTKSNPDIQGQHVEGYFNAESDAVKVIGCGTSDNDRKNAVEVKQDGIVYIKGIGGFTGANSESSKSVQEVINELVNKLNEITTND